LRGWLGELLSFPVLIAIGNKYVRKGANRLRLGFLSKAFSKSLDVVTPFERMARWVGVVPRYCCFACHWKQTNVERSKQTLIGFLDKAFSKSLDVVTPFERMALQLMTKTRIFTISANLLILSL